MKLNLDYFPYPRSYCLKSTLIDFHTFVQTCWGKKIFFKNVEVRKVWVGYFMFNSISNGILNNFIIPITFYHNISLF